jgi:hypothetical protein
MSANQSPATPRVTRSRANSQAAGTPTRLVNDPPSSAPRSSARIRNLRNSPSVTSPSRVQSVVHAKAPNKRLFMSGVQVNSATTTATPSKNKRRGLLTLDYNNDEDFVDPIGPCELDESFAGGMPGAAPSSPVYIPSPGGNASTTDVDSPSKGPPGLVDLDDDDQPSSQTSIFSQDSLLSGTSSGKSNRGVGKSPVWRHCTKNANGTVTCNHCKMNLNYSGRSGGSTSSLRHHLKNKHQIAFSDQAKSSSVPKEARSSQGSQATLGFKAEYLPTSVSHPSLNKSLQILGNRSLSSQIPGFLWDS